MKEMAKYKICIKCKSCLLPWKKQTNKQTNKEYYLENITINRNILYILRLIKNKEKWIWIDNEKNHSEKKMSREKITGKSDLKKAKQRLVIIEKQLKFKERQLG